MSEPFLAEIRIFAGNFAIQHWAFCNGQILSIAQNTALFALLGTTYGGDGRTTFALPNFKGTAPIEWGDGPGLSPYVIGEMSGEASVTVLQSEMPAHNHTLHAFGGIPDTTIPGPTSAPGSFTQTIYNTLGDVVLSPVAVSITGGNQPHNNAQPFLGLTFLIALSGIFPARG